MALYGIDRASAGRRQAFLDRSNVVSLVCETRHTMTHDEIDAWPPASSPPSKPATSTGWRRATPTTSSSGTTTTRSTRPRTDNLRRLGLRGRQGGHRGGTTRSAAVVLDDGFVQQHVLRGTAPGGALEVPAMMRVWVRDGRIGRIEEYLDTAQAAVLSRR